MSFEVMNVQKGKGHKCLKCFAANPNYFIWSGQVRVALLLLIQLGIREIIIEGTESKLVGCNSRKIVKEDEKQV